jgi:Flp pilus assembly protein TadG
MGVFIMLHRSYRNYRSFRSGAAAVELALLVLPVLTVLFLITTDVARLFYYSSIVNQAAYNGALYASDPTTQPQSPYYQNGTRTLNNATDITSAATSDTSNLSPAPNVDVKWSATASANPYTGTSYIAGTTFYVQVKVSWTFNTVFTYPGIANQYVLTRTVRMEITPP